MRTVLLRWARGPNLWKRRAAILCQIRFGRDTARDLLYACIEPSLLDAAPVRARVLQGPAKAGPHRARARAAAPNAGGPHTAGAVRDIRYDFFIRKAIGWALRQYARVEPAEVERYVKANHARLSPLSVREALKRVRRPGASACPP
jgi:3-methyladenine DNA glycosylase AlkD